MNAKFINSFLHATVHVLKTMALVEPKAGRPYPKNNNIAVGDVSGVVGMTGSATGSLALSFSEQCILRIVSGMLGEVHKGIDKEIEDAVGEITNMISGDARRMLQADGYKIEAAIPTVVSGKSHRIAHVLGGPSIIIPFEIEGMTFVVDVCLSD
jgi:chemotaxis protein CheX